MTISNYLKDSKLDEKIIKLKKEGLTNKEVAARLGYAESTINMHIRQIKNKEKKK